MGAPYSEFQSELKARQAARDRLRDPGEDGVILVTCDHGTVVLTVASSDYTLQQASDLPLGTRVTCFAQAASVTVNTEAISDGEFATFLVSLDASGDTQWVLAY
jgi:hypothetical protein